jgi:hypothetical protein
MNFHRWWRISLTSSDGSSLSLSLVALDHHYLALRLVVLQFLVFISFLSSVFLGLFSRIYCYLGIILPYRMSNRFIEIILNDCNFVF